MSAYIDIFIICAPDLKKDTDVIGKKALLLIILILIADQILKLWVKTHMVIGQEYICSELGIASFY